MGIQPKTVAWSTGMRAVVSDAVEHLAQSLVAILPNGAAAEDLDLRSALSV